MEENKQDGQWTDILYQEQIEMEEPSTQRAPIGEFVAHQFVGQKPTDKDTCQETYDRQEYLARDEVEPVEQRLSQEREAVDST